MSEPRTKPRWGWWIATGIAICIVAAALRLGLPIYRRSVALARLFRLEFTVSTTSRRPHWLVDWDRWGWTTGLESVDVIGDSRALFPSIEFRLSRSQKAELLTQIKVFSELESVALFGPGIEDADLVVLNAFPKLETLDLDSTSITGDGLRNLAGALNLRTLNLSGTQFDDSGLANLARLSKLEQLYLDRTRISNAGLKHLAKLPHLRELSVSNTAVTDAGLDELLKTRPALSVSDD